MVLLNMGCTLYRCTGLQVMNDVYIFTGLYEDVHEHPAAYPSGGVLCTGVHLDEYV